MSCAVIQRPSEAGRQVRSDAFVCTTNMFSRINGAAKARRRHRRGDKSVKHVSQQRANKQTTARGAVSACRSQERWSFMCLKSGEKKHETPLPLAFTASQWTGSFLWWNWKRNQARSIRAAGEPRRGRAFLCCRTRLQQQKMRAKQHQAAGFRLRTNETSKHLKALSLPYQCARPPSNFWLKQKPCSCQLWFMTENAAELS